MSEYSRALGEIVYKSRKALKMTQADLAELTGVTEQTIRKIEPASYELGSRLCAYASGSLLITVLKFNHAEFGFCLTL